MREYEEFLIEHREKLFNDLKWLKYKLSYFYKKLKVKIINFFIKRFLQDNCLNYGCPIFKSAIYEFESYINFSDITRYTQWNIDEKILKEGLSTYLRIKGYYSVERNEKLIESLIYFIIKHSPMYILSTQRIQKDKH